MARTKKIGLESKHNNAQPTASSQSSTATSDLESGPALSEAIKMTSNTNEPANTDDKTESANHLNQKTYRYNVVNAELTMPQASKFKVLHHQDDTNTVHRR